MRKKLFRHFVDWYVRRHFERPYLIEKMKSSRTTHTYKTHPHTYICKHIYMYWYKYIRISWVQLLNIYNINENITISSKTTHIRFHKKLSIQSWQVCVRGQWSVREKRSDMCILDMNKEPRLRERSDFSAEINKYTDSGKETNSRAHCRRRCNLVSLEKHQHPGYQIPWLSRHWYKRSGIEPKSQSIIL